MDNRIAYIELLGLTLSGRKKPDRGLYWTDLKGWWGLPDLRGKTDSIPGSHGNFRRVQHLREARVITLVGHILCKTNRELCAVRDRLEAALSQGAGLMRVVTNEYGSWDRTVEIDTLEIEPDHGKEYAKFTVDMLAPDPRRYGPLMTAGPASLPESVGGVRLPQRMPWNFGTVAEGSRLIIPNSGSIDVFPTLRMDGGFSQVSITEVNTGRRLRLEWPVAEGESVVLDSGSRRATLGSTEVTRWMTRRNWFSIPPGSTHEYRFEVQGAAGTPLMWGQYREGAW